MTSESYDLARVPLGIVKEFRESSCLTCQLGYQHSTISSLPTTDLELFELSQYSHDSVFHIGPRGRRLDNRLLLVPMTPSPHEDGHGVRVHSSLVSIERISHWLDLCNQYHRGQCFSIRKELFSLQFPVTVIDVQNWWWSAILH